MNLSNTFVTLKTQIQIIMKTQIFKGLFISALILGLVSCENEKMDVKEQEINLEMTQEMTNNGETDLGNAFYGKSSKSDCHFEYEGTSGPEFWADLCGEEWKDCAGNSQSPIDIQTGRVQKDGDINNINTNYTNTTIKILNNGHTLQFDYTPGSYANLNNIDYDLLQFHFHTGSEHTINGYRYPMEVHLVHKNRKTGLLAVVGVFFKEGRKDNRFLNQFINELPEHKGQYYISNKEYHIKDVLPEEMDFYTYSGSLTTPGCSEIVTWYVVKQPVYASAAQLERFKKIMHENFRPTQKLNDRVVRSKND